MAPRTRSPHPPSPESLDPAQVLLLLEDPAARARLTTWLGERNVQEMLSLAAAPPRAEGPTRRVVVLHGIMGAQLVDRRGLVDDVLWFDLPQLLYRGGIERLALTPDGAGDAAPGTHLEPTRPIRLIYDLLAWHIGSVGVLRVHPLAYDWRRSIDVSARRLHSQLEMLSAGDPSARFSIVAHSMGGVVTLRYAMLYPEHARRRLEQLVFMGVPIAGCFEPFQLFAGVHPTAKRVEHAAPGRGEMVRQVWATFPGMSELCPDPKRFDCATLWDPGSWSDLPPLARWLPRGRAWRADLRVPPFLLDRLDILLSASHPTCVGLTRTPTGADQRLAEGDGAVPIEAAWCEGARHWRTEAHHPVLPLDSDTRCAVVDLLLSRGQHAALPAVRALSELRVPPRLEQRPAIVYRGHGPDRVSRPDDLPDPGFESRVTRGEACQGDGMWLLGCDVATGPAVPPRRTRGGAIA